MPGINHASKPFFLFRMDVAGTACTHAVRGSLSSKPWNKCGWITKNFFKKCDNYLDKHRFLGFTHYCGKSKNGKFRVKRITSKKKMKMKLKKIKKWMRENINKPVVELIREINVKLNGHYNYYGITDNSKGINKYAYYVRMILFRHINRRRQGNPCDFLKFGKLLTKYPLAQPKIRVSVTDLVLV